MSEIHALASRQAKGKLEPYSYDPGPLGSEQVEIEVQYCGLCHSDVLYWSGNAGPTPFPFVPGHEVIGKIVALGESAKFLKVGQTVGLGWNSGSCLHCRQCLHGDHNLCDSLEMTIVGRPGGFATRVRCHWLWAAPLPAALDLAKAGPLMCAGITVFNPLVQLDIKPTDRVGVIGIGGLGHLALQFLNKWGCHVTAFSSSTAKADEVKKLGAHDVLDTHSPDALKKATGAFNLILSTVAIPGLDYNPYIAALAPKGHLHILGVIPEVQLQMIPLLMKQRSVSSSPSGAPATVADMLDFAARHNIAPITEEFPMSQANEAIERLESGKARYRIVLKNDLQ